MTNELRYIEPSWEPLSKEDLRTVEAQLGRRPEGAVAVVRRCRYGKPQVIASAPLRVNGRTAGELPSRGEIRSVSVFPTLYWLTCPLLRAAIGRLESAGWIGRLKSELEGDPRAAAELQEAHRRTARIRIQLVPEETRRRLEREYPGQYRVLTESGVAGMRSVDDAFGVKCLHAHFADYLAHGSNPIGRRTWALLTGGGVDPLGPAECPADGALVCSPLDMVQDQPQAVIDVGSNSVRLLVVRRTEDNRLKRLAAELITTRLGAGVATDGRLSAEAAQRTLDALRRLRNRAAEFGVNDPFAVGTNALRDATNREAFLVRAWEEAGVSLRVISGEEEALLSFRGALTAVRLDADTPVLLCDVGGGSTELVLGRASGRIEKAVSLPYGAVRLMTTERGGDGAAIALQELRSRLRALAGDVASRLVAENRTATLLCVGGTATTLAALEMKMEAYDAERVNGYRLSHERLRHWLEYLGSLDGERRSRLPGMPAGRADIMPYGLAILLEIALAFRESIGPEILISDNDLLHGVLISASGGL